MNILLEQVSHGNAVVEALLAKNPHVFDTQANFIEFTFILTGDTIVYSQS